MSNKNTNKTAPAKSTETAEFDLAAEKSKDHADAVAQLKILVTKLGAQQVLMTVGQHVTRNAEDFEGGIKFGRRCASIAKKVPTLAA